MRLALHLPGEPGERWTLARQIGVTDLVSQAPLGADGTPAADREALNRLCDQAADAGLRLSVVEGPTPMEDVRLGRPGRDGEVERFCRMIENLAAAGVEAVCYNFMAVFGWQRTDMAVQVRGGALSSAYDHERMERRGAASVEGMPPGPDGLVIGEEQLWEHFAWFSERVVPVAESHGIKLALHPDDPPLSPIRGVGRIMRSVENMERAIELVPSPCNGLTFCQGNFTAMGADLPAAIRRFGEKRKIFFVHFRDVSGSASRFVETFHDDGPTDMVAALRAYREVGFDGPVRPDHVPTMAGEPNDQPGYMMKGRLFAIGYLRGLLDALDAAG
ncbi:MAG: mannonate dehydratase [Spirochaetaceae bacterium]|nr:mannonate dehydratase [Spirochaetaceae bacterium]